MSNRTCPSNHWNNGDDICADCGIDLNPPSAPVTTTNSNCLAGLRCPQCGNQDRLFIHGTVRLDVTDDGAEVADGSDWYWDDASLAICPECDRDGLLAEFRVCPLVANERTPPDGFAYGFYQHSRAWYAEGSRLPSDVGEEIMVGFYHAGGGCRWEFAIRWIRLPQLTPRVEVFRDARASVCRGAGTVRGTVEAGDADPGGVLHPTRTGRVLGQNADRAAGVTPDDPIWDDAFHGCSFAAFVAEAQAVQGWPDSRAVKRRAYAMYEAELEARNAAPCRRGESGG